MFQGDPKPTLKEAMEDAHAKAGQDGHEKWLVAKIEVKGPNPIREYRVTLTA